MLSVDFKKNFKFLLTFSQNRLYIQKKITLVDLKGNGKRQMTNGKSSRPYLNL